MSQEAFDGIFWLTDWACKMERMAQTAALAQEREMCKDACAELISLAAQL
jgi:hypothetical protein